MVNRYFLSRENGFILSCYSWIPDSFNSIIIIVHGIGEHALRYGHVAEELNRAGSAVFSFDLRGHGSSAGKRGHIVSYEAVISDIDAVAEMANKTLGSHPLFIYGHSMGGGIVLSKRMFFHGKEAGYIVTSPWVELVNPPSPLLFLLAKALSWLLPSFTMPSGLIADLISTDKDVVKSYREDPLVHDRVSANTGVDGIEYGRLLLFSRTQPSAPLFLAHGKEDGIVKVEASRKLASRGDGNVTYLELPGYHELHNEPSCFRQLMDGIEVFIRNNAR